ncbi:MAG: DUF262 domain-containing protein [Clostridiales bacterium]|nr:DUF262 domain-containing protein [Clostridiales bacterium]
MDNYWKLEKYSVHELQEKIESNIITIPKYQRGIVWDKNKQKALIETIKKGFPFGSILVYEDKNGKQQLIDGLQRCTTIFNYVTSPNKFFDEQDIDSNCIYQIIELTEVGNSESVRATIFEEIKNIIIKWVCETHKTLNDFKQMQYYDIALLISQNFGTLQSSDKIRKMIDILRPMLQNYIESFDFISKVEIPVIKMFGKEENMPEIFERINSTGAKLTKYQIYNATWSNEWVKIIRPSLFDLVDYVCNRYDEMVEGNFEIEDYDSTKTKKDKCLNIFDLCFGFGKKLCHEFPYLFGKSEDKLKVEGVGFSLINACLGYKVSDLDKLHLNIKKIGDSEKINLFLEKIIETTREIDKTLRIVTTFKGNKRDSKNITINHTEMQIVSIIAFVFGQKYVTLEKDEFTETIKNRALCFDEYSTFWKENRKSFSRNCVKIYVMDCLNEKWRGSGDKKLNNIIFNGAYYYREVNWKEFESTLDLWFNGVLEERREEKKVANPKEPEKVLLNIIYAQSFKAADQLGEKYFDIEHLAPKATMRAKLERINKGKKDSERIKLPISSLGNMCYLPDVDNRSKGKKTIYEDSAYLRGRNIQEIEEKYSFTTHNDLKWIESDELSAEEFTKAYFEFVRNRWERMKQKIKECLFD